MRAESLCIAYHLMKAYNAPEDAQKLLEMVNARLNRVETMIAELSPVIGTHGGPGTAALAYDYED